MGTHASMLVVDVDRSQAAYGYEHGDGQWFMQDLLDFIDRRNRLNTWECRDDHVDELWPVTPAEFVTRWAEARRAEHLRVGRTGSGIETRTEGVDPDRYAGSEYSHLVVVNGVQVVSARRVYNARYGAGSSYTVTFDHAPVTRPEDGNTYATPPLHPPTETASA